jgi:hypothetical protein
VPPNATKYHRFPLKTVTNRYIPPERTCLMSPRKTWTTIEYLGPERPEPDTLAKGATPPPARTTADPVEPCAVCGRNAGARPAECPRCDAVTCPSTSARCRYVHLEAHAAEAA